MNSIVTSRGRRAYPGVKRKRGLGSIIGAVFLLLIIFTWYTYFQLSLKNQREYSNVLRTMQDADYKQRIENLEILSVSTTSQDKINITVRNNGENQAHLLYLGIHDEASNSHNYYKIDFYAKPAETLTDVRNESITIPSGGEREVQLITELGNVYSFSYPYTPSSGIWNGSSDQARVTITGIGLPHNPSNWDLVGSTTHVSGAVSDLVDNDGNYMVFRSYPSGNGTNIQDFVDNDVSNVDSSADKGTHSSFPAQQVGPDDTYDVVSEESVVSLDRIPPVYQSYAEASSPDDVIQIQVSKPSGAIQGDLLFAVFSKDADAGVLSSPIGWVDLGESSTGTSRVLFAYKIATSSEPGTYTFTSTDSDQMAVGIARFSGVNTSDPIDVYSSINTGTSATPQSPSIMTSVSNTTILRAMGADDDDVNAGSNYPTNHNGIFTIQSTGFWGETHGALAYTTQSTAGLTGTADFGLTASEEWGTMTIALNPSSSPSYEIDLEVQWTNVNYSESNEELAIFVGGPPLNTHSIDASGGYMIVGDGSPDWGSTVGTISFWIKMDAVANRPWGQHTDMEIRISGTNLVLDWGGDSLTSNTNFLAGTWYFIAVVWNEGLNELYLYIGDETSAPILDASNLGWAGAVSTLGVTENSFMASRGGVDPLDGHGDDLRYWDTDRSLVDIQSDYNTEITGSETNLRSYFKLNNNFDDIGPNNDDGSGSGSSSFSSEVPFSGSTEGLNVDVWYGSSWQNLITDLAAGWNNASVSSYLDSPSFTIRYKGAIETGDSTQDTWEIDAALLHLWTDSDRYTAEVNFTGTSNLEAWTELIWNIDSSWDLGAVLVSIQFYDFMSSEFVSLGNGYLSYVSDVTPDTDETMTQAITVSPTNFRNATGHWCVRIKGEQSTGTEFQMKIDSITIKPIYPTAGSSIEYNVWREYRIEGISSQNNPLSYGILSIYGNGTSLSLRDAITKIPITNPDWVYLDVEGKYYLDLRSSNGSPETFYTRAVVGSADGEKNISQLAP